MIPFERNGTLMVENDMAVVTKYVTIFDFAESPIKPSLHMLCW
jgi:hypothetical protein